MFLKRILADQAAMPHGILGRFVGRMMARGNRDSNEWVVSLLDLEEDDHVLEIGFGPGTAIRQLSAKVPKGYVAGIDISSEMVDQATSLNRKAIGEGRVDLRLGEASSMPWPDNRFDKSLAINVIYLWPQLGPVVNEVMRVLKPGGEVALYLAPIEVMENLGFTQVDVFTFHTPEEVKVACRDAGFTRVDERTSIIGSGTGVCVIARKQGA